MERSDVKRVQILDALETLHCRGQGQLQVGDAMSRELTCVPPHYTVLELVRMFHARGFRHLPVVDNCGRLLGVISDRDVLRYLGPQTDSSDELSQFTARELMSTDLVTVTSQAAITSAIDVMLEQGISCLPVVDAGRLVGILTNTDLHIVLQTLLQTVRLAGPAEPLAATAG